jgi:hypothetical protein
LPASRELAVEIELVDMQRHRRARTSRPIGGSQCEFLSSFRF